jgi:large subunit ribosomal protein L47
VPQLLTVRSFSSSYTPSPLDAFRDSADRETRAAQPVGRAWTSQELRRKSYEDLHKLWYVLYMERNMLMTENQLSRRRQLMMPQPQRLKKVQKSMGAVKQVLGERKRRKISDYKASKMEEALQDESEDMEDFEVSPTK